MKKDSSQELRRQDKFSSQGQSSRPNLPPYTPQSYGQQQGNFHKPSGLPSPKLQMMSRPKEQSTGTTTRDQNKVGNGNQQPIHHHTISSNDQRQQHIHSNDKKIGDRKMSEETHFRTLGGVPNGKPMNQMIIRTESDSQNPTLQEQRNRNQNGTSSQGRLLDTKLSGSQSTKALEKTSSVGVLHEYRHLHEKINTLENKILTMKTNLERKKEDKKKFLEAQIKDRKDRERQARDEADKKEKEERRQREENQRREMDSKRRQDDAKQKPQDKKPAKKNQENNLLKGFITQVPQHRELKTFEFSPYSPRNNIYYVSQVVKAYRQQNSLVRQHLLYSMHLLKTMDVSKRPTMFEIAAKGVNLVKKDFYKDKKTVIFDLDETLIHCNQNTSIPYDIKVPIKFPTGEVIQAGINIRPYAVQIIKNLSANFQVIVFTASHSCYANVVLDALDPERKYIQHRLFREHCHQTQDGMFVKDLRIVNRPLSDIVLVDNAAYSYAYQTDNGIPIIPYYQGSHDFQLSSLEKYLNGMVLAKDVREENRRTFKLDKYNNYEDPDQLVRELYSHAK